VDQARITLPEHASPRLGPDVVLRGRPADPPATELPLHLQARVDLGPDFQVRGRGLEAQARGLLEATGGASLATLRLDGQVDMAGGRYQAFGQRLRLERGLLRFTGPPLDPALDLLALRPLPPGETQRVGVQVSGRAQDPRVALWSDPALTAVQALSWLAVGQASTSGSGETLLLEDLAVSLLAGRAGLGGGTLAQRLGLDELAVRAGSTSGLGGAALPGATLAVGKRLARDLYAVYERGLSGVLGTLRVFYDINRRLQLRVETGDRTGLDLIYTVRIQ
jgi:translocation and assembly module TamB